MCGATHYTVQPVPEGCFGTIASQRLPSLVPRFGCSFFMQTPTKLTCAVAICPNRYRALCESLNQDECGKKDGSSWFSHRCVWAKSEEGKTAASPRFGCSSGRWLVLDAGTCPGGGGIREAVCQTMLLEQCWSSPDCTDEDKLGKCSEMVSIAGTTGTCKFACGNVKGGSKKALASCNACLTTQFGTNGAFLRDLADCCGCMIPTLSGTAFHACRGSKASAWVAVRDARSRL